MPVQVQTVQQTQARHGVLNLKGHSVSEESTIRNRNNSPLAYNGSFDKFEVTAEKQSRTWSRTLC
jgi:hypothetical protein